MAEVTREVVQYEPLRSNRWIVKLGDIPEWLMASFKLRNEKYVSNTGRKPKEMMGLKLDISMRNAIMHMVTPEDVMGCKKIKISFLDPVGVEVSYYDLSVELDTFDITGDYANDGLLMTECSFWVTGMDSSDSLTKDEEVLKNYKEKKES
jgi:hypothetical protein